MSKACKNCQFWVRDKDEKSGEGFCKAVTPNFVSHKNDICPKHKIIVDTRNP